MSLLLFNGLLRPGGAATPPPLSLGARYWFKCDTDVYESTDTSDPAEAGDPVALWSDQSGNGYKMDNTGLSGTRPTWDSGNQHLGRNTLRFTASGVQFLQFDNAGFSGLTEGEIFITCKMVADPAASSASAGFWTMNDGSAFSVHHPWTDGVIYDNTFSTTRQTVGDEATALTSWHVYHVRSTSGDWEAYIDNVSVFSTGTNTPAFPAGLNQAYLGKAFNNNHHMDGWVAELVIFPNTLTSGERASVYDYMANG